MFGGSGAQHDYNIKMEKNKILLKTLKSFCEIAQGEYELELDQANCSPSMRKNPYFESSKDLLNSALEKSVKEIRDRHNLGLPDNLSYPDLVEKVISTKVVDPCNLEPIDLMKIYNMLEDLILRDVHSSTYQTIINLLNNLW